MEEVEWRGVYGYKDLYEVNNIGVVRSINRIIKSYEKRTGCYLCNRMLKGRVLKTFLNEHGYMSCTLSKNGKTRTFEVHRLVAFSFFGHPKHSGLVTDHINGKKTDNNIKNLRFVTSRENTTTCFKVNSKKLTSQYVGVCWKEDRRRWRALITINGKQKELGLYQSELDAAAAYQKALKSLQL
jgi:hypothetical protein